MLSRTAIGLILVFVFLSVGVSLSIANPHIRQSKDKRLTTKDELWQKLKVELQAITARAKARDIEGTRRKILRAKETLSMIESTVEDRLLREKILTARGLLEETVRAIDSRKFFRARDLFKKALSYIKSIERDRF